MSQMRQSRRVTQERLETTREHGVLSSIDGSSPVRANVEKTVFSGTFCDGGSAVDERRAWEGTRIDLLGVISETAKPCAQRIRIVDERGPDEWKWRPFRFARTGPI